jgi:endonuclease/exonuclease/phosphatase family metal-dependent hydrolase
MRFLAFVIGCCLWIGIGCGPVSLSFTAPGPAAEQAVTSLRVLSYNIHHANPPSKPGLIDVAAIANVIKQQEPDLVALQEVDVYTNRSGKSLDQAAEIAKLAGMPYHFFARAIDHDGGEYGVAILSRYPIEEKSNDPLPTEESTAGEHRTLATVTVTLPQRKKVIFACTHLDAQRPDTNRFLQINKIINLLLNKPYPVIIAGDLNAVPGTRVIDKLDAYFTRSCQTDCAFTIPQVSPDKTIDFIAYRPKKGFTVTEHKTIDEQYASDHLPVLAVVRIK